MTVIAGNRGFVDANNSTTATLLGGISWVGGWTDVAAWGSVSVIGSADQPGTLFLEFSTDGVTVHRTVQASDGVTSDFSVHGVIPIARFFRARVVNGAAPQGSFNFQTLINSGARISIPTSRLAQPLSDYSDVLNVRAAILGQLPSGTYANAGLSESSLLQVDVANPLSAFGHVRTAQLSPIAQLDAVYGIRREAETFSAGTGSATVVDGNFVCATGVGIGGYGVVRARRAIRYRAGQGTAFRLTALFDSANAVADSLQAAGAFNSASGFFVGYGGPTPGTFGVMHRTDGKHEIQTFTITAAAVGAETLNLELNTVTYNIPVTAGSIQHNGYEVAAWLNNPANQTVWEAYQNDDTVVLLGLNPAPLSGVYSVASTGAIAGNVARNTAGVVNTETWIYQGSFSIDNLDGTGPSGMVIDPDMGNVFQFDIQYLGYGNVQVSIESPLSGRFFVFHQFSFANMLTVPILINPTLKAGWIAASVGSTTAMTVRGASAMGGVDGPIHPFRNPDSFSLQRTGVGATLTSIFAIRVRSVFNGLAQLSEVLPKIAFASPEGNKAAEVQFLLNPTFNAAISEPDWNYFGADSIVELDVTGTVFSDTGSQLASFVVAGSATESLNFVDIGEESINPIHLERGDVLCIAAKITGGAGNNVTASLTWLED